MNPLPDILEIEPLAKPPNCTITVPGSKSITNRALILAALSDKKCKLHGALWADDTQVMVDSLQKLGFEVKVEPDPDEECNRIITVVGRGGEIPARKTELYVGNAGTAARFLTALVALGDGKYRITGDARMQERPMGELFKALRSLKVKVDAPNDCLPATILTRGITGGELTLEVSDSTQFASALLLIAKHGDLRLNLPKTGAQSLGYINMTQEMLRTFQPDYRIEPDYSGASYFWGAGYVAGGTVNVAGWSDSAKPMQIDARFPSFLPPPAKVSRLRDLGDSVMTLTICALFGKVPLQLTDASWMRLQESDRLGALVAELKKVGARAEETKDGLTVWPAEPGQLHGADIETYNDHRIAMCFSLLGLKVPGIRIKNPLCVNKTFPNFFEKLEQLRL